MCGGSHQCFGGSLGEKAVFGSCRVLLLAKSQPVFRWLALARRRFSGVVVCWSDRSHSVLVARFDEEALVGGQELMGAKITAFLVAILYIWREGSFGESCICGSCTLLPACRSDVGPGLAYRRRERSLRKSVLAVIPGVHSTRTLVARFVEKELRAI